MKLFLKILICITVAYVKYTSTNDKMWKKFGIAMFSPLLLFFYYAIFKDKYFV